MAEQLTADVLIVGGGIVGCAAALFLSARGRSVLLLERDRCGAHSSGINYGGVRRQGRAFAQLPLAQRAHRLWQDLTALIGTEGEYLRSGHLKLARSGDDMAKLESYRAGASEHGLELELLGPGELKRRYPWLGDGIAGASLCADDGQANPRLISPAFANAARTKGARILERQAVQRIERVGDNFIATTVGGISVKAAVLLNCAGAWAGAIAAPFGDDVPLSVGHPAMAVTEPLPHFLTPSLGMQGGDIYCRQVARGNVVLGGGRVDALPGAPVRSTSAAILAQMTEIARLIPRLEHAQIIRSWSGNEAYLPDRQPVLCASPSTPGLFHGFGFSGAGFQIGPSAGEILAELVVDGVTATPIETFDIRRFSTPPFPVWPNPRSVT